MKSIFFLEILIAVISLTGCEQNNNDLSKESIIGTEWILSKVIANETGQEILFPKEIQKFTIIFKKNGLIELPNNCNFHFGSYTIIDNDSLIITAGPGTKIYCLPDLLMEWETLFIPSLVASKTYSLINNQLTIHSDSDYDLVFDYVDDYNKGMLLVCTNSNMLNCVFEIDFSVNNISYSLTADSSNPEYECQCKDSLNFGFLLELKEGTYAYTATELNCVGDNKVNSWSGEINVTLDSCSNIFLDIFVQ